MKRLLILASAGMLVMALGISLIGNPVFAQETSTPETEETAFNPRQEYINAVAASLGVTPDELEAAMGEADLQLIDEWAAAAKERVGEGGGILAGRGGMPGFLGQPGLRAIDRIHGGRAEFGIAGHMRSESLADFATFLGITEDELRAELRDGSTLLQIAEANGKTVNDVRTYMITQATERIDAALERAEANAANTVESSSEDSTPTT